MYLRLDGRCRRLQLDVGGNSTRCQIQRFATQLVMQTSMFAEWIVAANENLDVVME